jgi:GcrA cell cycle regulator
MQEVEWKTWMNLRLRLLWGRSNVTIPEIATKLGRISEDAVCARAELLKLGVRKGFQPPATTKPQVIARKAADSSTRSKLVNRARLPTPAPYLTEVETANRDAVEADRAKTGRAIITLFDLKSGMCKWPISDWGESVHFCGNEQQPGSPYCPGHKNLAYRKPYPSERGMAG